MSGVPVLDGGQVEAVLPTGSGSWFPYFTLTGGYERERALEADRRVRQFSRGVTSPDSEEYKRLLDAFICSPLTGCTTVLDQLRIKANYDPSHPDSHAAVRFFYICLAGHPL